jgi:hypothetical protein
MKVLYHYCSTEAFHAIVESRSLRLSSLSLSNDTLEGKLVGNTFLRLAKRDKLDKTSIQQLQHYMEIVERGYDGLGFCLSEVGDLLSQWRGYASDATGVSIGFSREYLEWLAEAARSELTPGFTVETVHYDSKVHEAEIEPAFLEVKKLIKGGAFRVPRIRLPETRTDEEIQRALENNTGRRAKVFAKLLKLFPKFFLLKSHAFSEEREWRLLSDHAPSVKCSYRTLPNRIVPYRSFELLELRRQPIVEIVLGPKHLTPIKVVEDFLKERGFGTVLVKVSEASYR